MKFRYSGQELIYGQLPLERDEDGNPTRVAPHTVNDGDVVELACDPPDDGHWSAADDHTGPLLRPDNEPDGDEPGDAPIRQRRNRRTPPPQDPPQDPPLDPENTDAGS